MTVMMMMVMMVDLLPAALHIQRQHSEAKPSAGLSTLTSGRASNIPLEERNRLRRGFKLMAQLRSGTHIHFRISYSMGAQWKCLFWPPFRHLVVNHEWVLLSIGWVALYSEKLIENKHPILTFNEHPLPVIADYWLMSFPNVIERAHLLFWPNDIWRMW